jgi:hypothetical protein
MNLIDVYKKVIKFLNKEKNEYLVIGGLAAGIIGEPRATGDIDIDIILDKNHIEGFLKRAKIAGFEFAFKECIKRARETGTFQIKLSSYNIDFIIVSIDLEISAIKRKRIVKIHNVSANFPTPEDLILLKIIPGRVQDMLDVEKIVIKHSGKLDRKYLLDWAQKLSDESEDMRIYKKIKKLLNKN